VAAPTDEGYFRDASDRTIRVVGNPHGRTTSAWVTAYPSHDGIAADSDQSKRLRRGSSMKKAG
jgi:hypothetical protein